jgi:pyruvate dehydrogenase E2 component (dihydrolipoamide acetyltransferase)
MELSQTERGVKRAREAVERTVTASWQIPQFWTAKRLDVDAVSAWLGAREGAKVTLSDAIVWACAARLADHPEALPPSGWEDGIAVTYLVAAGGGLLGPSLPAADRMSLEELAGARREMVARAKTGRLGAADARPGAFAISNLGPTGIDAFQALVLPGQRAILAVGGLRPELRLVDGEPVETTVMDLVLSVDHRHVDGTQSAAFLIDVKATIEGLPQSDLA